MSKRYDGVGNYVCDTCKGKWRTLDELKTHNQSSLHKIEVVRKQINMMLTALEFEIE